MLKGNLNKEMHSNFDGKYQFIYIYYYIFIFLSFVIMIVKYQWTQSDTFALIFFLTVDEGIEEC